MLTADLLIVILSLLFSAYFSGMEIAYLSSNRLQIEVHIQRSTWWGKLLNLLYSSESRIIVLLLLGNNVCLVAYGISFARLLEPLIQSWGVSQEIYLLLIQTGLSTLLVLFTAEFLPKAFVQVNPYKFLQIGAPLLLILYYVLYLPTQFILSLNNLILKLFGQKTTSDDKVFSKIDLEHYVEDITTRMKQKEDLGNEMIILKNALEFSKLKARDCMIPRTDIVAVDIEDDLEEVKAKFLEKGLSKILIFRDTIDNIIGYVHSYDLFKQPKNLKQVLKPISFVPSVISGKELLEKFLKQAGSIAVVTDEYGGTAGIVTLEDVIEEIFGEIEDEHDKEEFDIQQISDKEFIFSARVTIEHLNENYNLKFTESEEFDTLGGLILHTLEKIPEKGTTVKFKNYKLIVEEVSARRIEKVRLLID